MDDAEQRRLATLSEKGDTKPCSKCKTSKPLTEFACSFLARNQKHVYSSACKDCENARHRAFSTEQRLLTAAKHRARRDNLPLTITLADIVVPERCPVFHTRLVRGGRFTEDPNEDAATLDKIVPSLGYVPGNIAVISHRANRVKSCATLSELRKLADWIRSRSEKSNAS